MDPIIRTINKNKNPLCFENLRFFMNHNGIATNALTWNPLAIKTGIKNRYQGLLSNNAQILSNKIDEAIVDLNK